LDSVLTIFCCILLNTFMKKCFLNDIKILYYSLFVIYHLNLIYIQ